MIGPAKPAAARQVPPPELDQFSADYRKIRAGGEGVVITARQPLIRVDKEYIDAAGRIDLGRVGGRQDGHGPAEQAFPRGRPNGHSLPDDAYVDE